MDKNKNENGEYQDYFNSFVSAFDLKRIDTPLSISSENDDYIYDYLRYSFESSQPPMQKSLSWSSTDPSLAYERDCYLSPYACNDLQRLQTLPARPRSVTLPAKSHSSKYLHVTQLQYENRFRSSSLSSNASTTPSHLEAIEERSSSSIICSSSEEHFEDLCEKEINVIFNVQNNELPSMINATTKNMDRNDNSSFSADGATYTPYATRRRSQTAPPTISITTISANKDSNENFTENQMNNILVIDPEESQNFLKIKPDKSQSFIELHEDE